jgi:hypothetical protein
VEVQKNDEVLGLTTAKTQASTSDQQPSINKTMALAQLSPLNPSNLSVNEKSAEELPAKVSTGKHVFTDVQHCYASKYVCYRPPKTGQILTGSGIPDRDVTPNHDEPSTCY